MRENKKEHADPVFICMKMAVYECIDNAAACLVYRALSCGRGRGGAGVRYNHQGKGLPMCMSIPMNT